MKWIRFCVPLLSSVIVILPSLGAAQQTGAPSPQTEKTLRRLSAGSSILRCPRYRHGKFISVGVPVHSVRRQDKDPEEGNWAGFWVRKGG